MAEEMKTEAEKLEKLGQLIDETRICMLTTVTENGRLHSRPMGYLHPKDGFDGMIRFFTSATSPKAEESAEGQQVNVSFADTGKQDYVSVSGTARLSFDKIKMQELWNPFFKAWFPKELEEPGIALLEVTPESAAYWDSPSGALVMLYGTIKATLTGKIENLGEHQTIDMQ